MVSLGTQRAIPDRTTVRLMITPDTVRAKADTFDVGLRGFHSEEVRAYLSRIALILDVIGDEPGPLPALPPDIRPAAIRQQKFTVAWRGCNPEQVAAYLDEVATHLDRRLNNAQAAPSASLDFGINARARVRDGQASGILQGIEVVKGNRRRSVTFCTPEGLARHLAARLVDTHTCLVSDIIIVSSINPETMKRATDHLASIGEL